MTGVLVPPLGPGGASIGPARPSRVTVAGRCRMRACLEPVEQDGWCRPHLLRFAHDPAWVPVAVVEHDDGTVTNRCGLCGLPVWTHLRAETGLHVVLDRDADPMGRWHLVDGGARDVRWSKVRAALAADGIPLYRLHAPICARRPKLVEIVL